MQLLQPAGEDGVRRSSSSRDGRGCSSSREERSAAFLLDPLADFWSIEVVEVTLPTAASGMHSCDCLQCSLEALLAQQFAECIEDDAITDAEVEMEGSGDYALGRDGEKWLLASGAGVFVVCIAITGSFEQTLLRDDADGTGVSGRRGHEAKDSVDEAPVAVEEGRAGEEMLPECLPLRSPVGHLHTAMRHTKEHRLVLVAA